LNTVFLNDHTISYHHFPSLGEKNVFRQSELTELPMIFFFNLFWVYDLFTLYKFMKTMPILNESLQKHCITNVVFRIQRFYKGD